MTTSGSPSPELDLADRVGGAELAEGGGAEGDPVGGRDAGLAHPVLGLDLVHAEHAGGDARTGVGDAEQLEQRLDGPVLAAGAVEGDEGDLGPLPLEPGDELLVGVDRDDVVAELGERVLDPRARLQRDLALERAAALEDRDLHLGRLWKGTTSPVGCSPLTPGREAEDVGAMIRCSPVIVS